MQVGAKVLVTEEVAQSLPSRPDRVRECMNAAQQAMDELAAEKGRRISESPRLAEQRPNGLGFLELTFVAETVKR